MGQTISSILLPIVTINTDQWSDWYEFNIKPYLWTPSPRRIVAINWSRLASNIFEIIWDGVQCIPGLVWSAAKFLFHTAKFLYRNAMYPVLIGVPLIIGYYVVLSMSEPGVISPRRLKETSQQHFLSNDRAHSGHPLRVYADETNSI